MRSRRPKLTGTSSLPSLDRQPKALQWLPPSRLRDPQLSADARVGTESMLVASWLTEFEEQSGFGSAALFIEFQLRQALAATSTNSHAGPDSFRTACVCEALARLPEATGSFAGVLQLLRSELLRSVYIDCDRLARRGRPIDAQGLLSCKTYFAECEVLRREKQELEESLSDWHRAKQELTQDSEGRNELLRLAGARSPAGPPPSEYAAHPCACVALRTQLLDGTRCSPP